MPMYESNPGRRYPPGAVPDANGVNFSIFCRFAESVELLLYEAHDSPDPFQIIPLDPAVNRTYYAWHVYVEGLPRGVHYTWRMGGPGDTRISGFRFNRRKELLDPWARAVTDTRWARLRALDPEHESHDTMRAVVPVDADYDWEGDRPLERPMDESVIYEAHLAGFTRHPSSGVTHPGTFAGFAEKIPYLVDLGITHVELLPVMAFDCQDVSRSVYARGLANYWGYSPHSFWSPHPGYCVTPELGTHRREFRDLVKALHKAGIGVILDVVFNHTAEGDATGPTINFKGLGNSTFYHLDPMNKERYLDYTGCGNTVNCNHPLVAQFIVECLEYWVREMHVDGFRFDLASVLARGEDGRPMANAPVVWSIELSDVLAHTPLIAEAWDAAGLYQVGAFPGLRWAEWNGRYRDVIRRFVRGDVGLVGEVATRIAGSSDLYESSGRLPANSINFVTCHDGFTLHDLVSYEKKHNEANGEDNRDGSNANYSWNGGIEGETDDPLIVTLRQRQMRNLMAILLLSQGVPMLLAGDEMRRTQQGNNNAYCQNNEISWVDWTLLDRHRDMHHFCRGLIALRKRHPSLRRPRFLSGRDSNGRGFPDITWHGVELDKPLWDEPGARVLAFTLAGVTAAEEDLHVVLNMSDVELHVALPTVVGRPWYRAMDTGLPPPEDLLEPARQPLVSQSTYAVGPRSVVVFEAR